MCSVDIDIVSTALGEYPKRRKVQSFVAASAATAASQENTKNIEVFLKKPAASSAASCGTTNTPEAMSFVDYVLQDCPEGPVMNPTDEELAEAGLGTELFAKLGEHATAEQIQGLATLIHDAKLLKIERIG